MNFRNPPARGACQMRKFASVWTEVRAFALPSSAHMPIDRLVLRCPGVCADLHHAHDAHSAGEESL